MNFIQEKFSPLTSSVLFTDNDSESVGNFYCTADAEIAAYIQPSPHREDPNQDSAGIFPVSKTGCILAVADGMGGMPLGAEASRVAIQAIPGKLLNATDMQSGYRETVLNAIESANAKVQGMNVGAGSTLAIVSIVDNTLRSFHIGDSEIFVVGQKGKIKLQTMPHTPAGYALEAGMIDEGMSLQHAERHLLTNYVGSAEMRIDMGPQIKLDRYDTVLLASDGVFDNLDRNEIIDLIRKGNLIDVLQELSTVLRQRMLGDWEGFAGKPDDVACILFRRRK